MDDGKNIYILLSVIFSITIATIAILGFNNSDYRTRDLDAISRVDLDQITKVSLNSTFHNSSFRSTTNQKEIEFLVNHLVEAEYKRLLDDKSSYMPERAGMIYLYENDKADFIIPYETEAMINHKVYRLKHSTIDNNFLEEFYSSLNE